MTYRAEECPACTSTAWRAYPAVVAPFVAEYALGVTGPAPPTQLLECRDCGLVFFEDRYTETEIAKLYDGYRGERYFEARHRHEPWYTRGANAAIGDDAERRSVIERFAKRRVAHVGDLLDYGGDRGQYIPQGLADRRFVYEISGVEPVAGVSAIAEEKELEGRTFDLVLLCHVLEHASSPRELLARVARSLREKDGVLYIEVPFERPSLRFLGAPGSAYSRLLAMLRRVGPALKLVDFYSTLFRVKLGFVPPLGLMKLHEHVNFFDERSLRAVIEAAGLEPVEVGLEVSGTQRVPVVCALARRRA
jgi:SAM-dependent methyltransferase